MRKAETETTFAGITIQYGITPARVLLDAGYTLSDLEQITEEPTIAACLLRKDNRVAADLCFYTLTEATTLDKLADVPIDLLLPQHPAASRNPKRTRRQTTSAASKLLLSCLIHLVSAGLFACIYAVPQLFTFVQNGALRINGNGAPLGIVLLILPAILIVFLCGGGAESAGGKLRLSLVLIANVAVSLAYLISIDYLFTFRL